MSKSRAEQKHDSFDEQICFVIKSISEAGYDPINQLYGYLLTGNPSYITRTNDARQIVTELDQTKLREFVKEELRKNNSKTITM